MSYPMMRQSRLMISVIYQALREKNIILYEVAVLCKINKI
jgi:hypothetical protein